MKIISFISLMSICGLGIVGCSKSAPENQATGIHQDVAPHGGAVVPLGENYHLELVRDAETGTLSGFVLDDELEGFVRSSSASIQITAQINGQDAPLTLAAVPNSATGESVGDTALFEGQADWLKTTADFKGVLRNITVRGTRFGEIKFQFPHNE